MTFDGRGVSPHRRRLLVTMLALTVGACASKPRDGPAGRAERPPEAAVTVAAGSLVFARERPELAVHARDYLTLVPIVVDRGGTRALYLCGYAWSTIDKRALPDQGEREVEFELVADGRRIPLTHAVVDPRELGLPSPPVRAPSAYAQLILAATDRETLAFLAEAREIRAVAHHDGGSEPYELWKDGRDALLAVL
jgi:hypothetical protein